MQKLLSTFRVQCVQGLEGYSRDTRYDQNAVRGFGKKQNILTGFGISPLSGKRDSLTFGHGTRELFSVCQEIGKLLPP